MLLGVIAQYRWRWLLSTIGGGLVSTVGGGCSVTLDMFSTV